MNARRYVRLLASHDHSVGGWHEMIDDTSHTLCDRWLPMAGLDSIYQHLRGTGFPDGDVCTFCKGERAWQDVKDVGVLTSTAEAPEEWV